MPMVERKGCLCQWWQGRGDCTNGRRGGVSVPMMERKG